MPVIRQHIEQKGGVLVCRPDELDGKILRLFSASGIRNIEHYADWLQNNISYASDDARGLWASPEELLKIKRGDCEDYAFLNAAILRVMGYESKVLAMGKRRNNHAICVFKKEGYYYWFDNTRLRKTSAKTLSEFSQYIFLNFDSDYLLELNFDNKSWKILYLKSKHRVSA